METAICKKCGKRIEGYSSTHVEYMLWQHELAHKLEDRKIDEAQIKKAMEDKR